MTKIKVRLNESLEQALRRFNREVLKSGILEEYKSKDRFVKPSEVRRQKAKQLQRKLHFERLKNK